MNRLRTSLPPCRISDPTAFGRVAVLLGGRSAEREVSLRTGQAVLDALCSRGVDARAVDPADGALSALLEGKFDRVWLALHGRGGEDGSVQGALEYMGLPFTGSGVLGSAIGMDKVRSKRLIEAAGLGTPAFAVVRRGDALDVAVDVPLPAAVKPACEGSSLGMTRVTDPEQLPDAVAKAREFDHTVLVEHWVDGVEYTAGIIGGVALPLIRIETARTFYDYTAKYHDTSTQYHCPSGLDDAAEIALRAQAIAAFEAVGGHGWGRVDFMLDREGRALFLEVNTLPGMTATSLVPCAAAEAGCDFPELAWRILETSLDAPVPRGSEN
ncbi:MAG: D-alanine--D-alanine ligase [Pseudomonadota bacterium]